MAGKEIINAIENKKTLEVKEHVNSALTLATSGLIRQKTLQTVAKVYPASINEDAEDIFLKNVKKRIQDRVKDHQTISPELASSSGDHRPTEKAKPHGALPTHPKPVSSKGSDQYDNPQRQGIELGEDTVNIAVDEDVYRQLSGVARNHHATVNFTFENGVKTIPVSTQMAGNICAVRDALSEENQKMFDEMLQTYSGFYEMINFAKFEGK